MGFLQPSGILVMDPKKSHLTDYEKREPQKSGAQPAIIHGEITKTLQTLDLTVNHSFKTQVRKHREKWMVNDFHSFTKKCNMKATYKEVAKFVSQTWKDVPVSSIKSGFSQAGIIPLSNNENYDISDNDTDQYMDILYEENLQLFHSHIDDSDFEVLE